MLTQKLASRLLRPVMGAASSQKIRLNSSSHSQNYDGPGKTTVNVLNQEVGFLMVDAVSASGFRLNNSMKTYGPIALFPTCVLAWNVKGCHDLNLQTLSLFSLVFPRPDIIIIGLGDRDQRIDAKAYMELRRNGLKVECFNTEDAAASYNYLCSEGRAVAAGLIPPDVVSETGDYDIFERRVLEKNVHGPGANKGLLVSEDLMQEWRKRK